ncbi:MAG TPA: hypothetical protein VK575_08420 [Gemmatimonadaceae bacterium]|nr:hypothetical protein [Gemmatimonadaceae bacterium]
MRKLTRAIAVLGLVVFGLAHLSAQRPPSDIFAGANGAKGRGNGYIVTLGGKRFYFAGDTSCTPEIKALQNIDVAFLP